MSKLMMEMRRSMRLASCIAVWTLATFGVSGIAEARALKANIGLGYENTQFESNLTATGPHASAGLDFFFPGPTPGLFFGVGPTIDYSDVTGTKDKEKFGLSETTVGLDGTLAVRLSHGFAITTGLAFQKGISGKITLGAKSFEVSDFQRICHPWNAVFAVGSDSSLGFGATWCTAKFGVNTEDVSGASQGVMFGGVFSRRI